MTSAFGGQAFSPGRLRIAHCERDERVDEDALETEAFERVGVARRPAFCGADPPCEGGFSFGNGCQAIEIARTYFDRFFQMRVEIVG